MEPFEKEYKTNYKKKYVPLKRSKSQFFYNPNDQITLNEFMKETKQGKFDHIIYKRNRQ